MCTNTGTRKLWQRVYMAPSPPPTAIVASAHQWQRPLLLTTPLQRNLPGKKNPLKFVAAKSTRDRHFLDFDAGPQRECPYFKLAYKNQWKINTFCAIRLFWSKKT